jgi:general secretion pathway protein A
MYAPFFGLQQEAFSIAPDPRFLHLSAMHREALAHLLYGLQAGGGFVLLTGEVGAGKTTVCRCFLEQVPAGHRVAYVYNPQLTPVELLQTICQEFGAPLPDPPATSVKPYVDALNAHLLAAHAAGEHCLLVIDEAQALSAELLEQLRLLTNLETSERKLLQVVLIGQPELRTLLARPELEQLSQRVIARVHLGPLQPDEVTAYVAHRLAVAGLVGEMPFDRRALTLVQRISGGVPRRINLLCQRALLGAYGSGTRHVGPDIVRQAAREVFGSAAARRGWSALRTRWRAQGAGARPSARPGPREFALVAGAAAVALSTGWVVWSVGAGHGIPWTAGAGITDAAGPEAGAASASSAGQDLRPFDTEAAAWTALAERWSLPATASDSLCDAPPANGVSCYEGTADLALLRRLQRPVLLNLQDGGLVLLQSLGPDGAQVQGRQPPHRVTLDALQAAWSGRFSTLWRPPPGWLTAGGRLNGDAANWVLEQLTTLQGEAAPGGPRASRDDVLRQRVFAFQVAQGLALDGVAGPLTLMQLNRAAGVDEPRWSAEPRSAEPRLAKP